jgi:hypothetical protein
MVPISVFDLPEKTYCTTDHIHFAATSTIVAFSLEKGRTYLVVKTTFAYRSDVHSNTAMRIVSKRYHALLDFTRYTCNLHAILLVFLYLSEHKVN